MRTKLDKLRNLADNARAVLQVSLYYAGFKTLEEYFEHIHNIESFESFHKLDDVLKQLDYYTTLQIKILQELEGIKFLKENQNDK